MFRYILKRLIQMVPLLFIISLLGFGIIRVAEVYANADPLAQMKMSPTVTAETIRREKSRLGYETAFSENIKLTEANYTPTKINASTKVSDDSISVKIKGGEALNRVETDSKVKPLAAGEYRFENNVFAFNTSVIGKELELEYSTPNGFMVRYFKWIVQFIKGDMGESYYYKSPVSSLILSRLGNTIILGIATLLVTWLIAVPLGIYLAVRQYSLIDQFASSISYFFMGFPDFFLAIIFLLFAAKTGWFPIGEMQSIKAAQSSMPVQFLDLLHHLVLPTLTLSMISIATLQRRMRANMLDILSEEYIKTARAKGLPEKTVIYKHAVRNAINPIITLLGFEIAGLVSGAAFVEIIFSWPGLGNMMLQALLGTDLNLVMAGLIISTVMLLLGNLLADLLLAFADPRIKLEA
jgi:peptide/nickel transport system permease protein